MPQWIAREYLARRGGAKFRPDQIVPARCPLLGWLPKMLVIEGTTLPPWFLDTALQREVKEAGYDAGARILLQFFERQLPKYLEADLAPVGRQIIECCLQGGSVDDYVKLLPPA
jgi:hypothetical protein